MNTGHEQEQHPNPQPTCLNAALDMEQSLAAYGCNGGTNGNNDDDTVTVDEDWEEDNAYVWDDARPILKYLNFFIGDSRDGATMLNFQSFYLMMTYRFDYKQTAKLGIGYGVCQLATLAPAGFFYDKRPSRGIRWLQYAVLVNAACILSLTYVLVFFGDDYNYRSTAWTPLISSLFVIKCIQGVATAFIPTGMSTVTLG